MTSFLCDEMLGALARTLRLLGFDAEYAQDTADGVLLESASAQGRVLLTRDKELAARAAGRGLPAVLVRAIEKEAQTREVLAALGLVVDPVRVLTRCSTCNGELRAATAEEAARAPPGAAGGRWTCARCGQLYWEGTHAARIRAMAERLTR